MVEAARNGIVTGIDLEIPQFFPEIRLPNHVTAEEIAQRTGGDLDQSHKISGIVVNVLYPQLNARLFIGKFGDEERNRHPASPSFEQRDELGSKNVDISLRHTAMILLDSSVCYVREDKTRSKDRFGKGIPQKRLLTIFSLGNENGYSLLTIGREHVEDPAILRAADMAKAAYTLHPRDLRR